MTTQRIEGLPTALEQLTPEWLTGALSQRCGDVEVRGVEITDVIWGTATKVFVGADYARRGNGEPPEALCVKGGFDDAMRSVAGLGYRVEARFYRDLAPAFGDSVPRCWYAHEDEPGNQGLVIIDDLRAAGATFGRPQATYTVDQVAGGLEALAAWHGESWDRTGVGGFEWLTVGSQLFRPVVQGFLRPEHWDEYMTREQTRSFDAELRDRERVATAVDRLWERDDAGVLSISHGDPHTGNVYSFDDGALRFLDWQTTCLAPWADDVAYFLVGVLDVEERRAREQELLGHYLAALSATGAPAPGFDDAWLAYRQHHLHGLMFALCPPEMQPPEVCTLMGDRYATAAIDHETLAAMAA